MLGDFESLTQRTVPPKVGGLEGLNLKTQIITVLGIATEAIEKEEWFPCD